MTAGPVSPAKRSSPPPPTDLSRPNAGQPPSKRPRDSKFDPTVLPKTSDAAEILKQVEFYFSDANLPRDKFLWTLTASDPKKEGWVPISQIASFKRMQRFQPLEAIVSALRGSKELLEVNEDGTAVRRKIPLVKPTSEKFQEINNRSLHVKGFGDETSTLQIDLEAYFRGFGEIDSLRLRRTDTGLFKGSVIVQFKNQTDAEKFLAEPQEWNGSLLDAKTKAVWIQGKKEEDENLTWDERRERDNKREESRFKKPFSAFKEMEKNQSAGKNQGRNKGGNKQGRRGRRDDRPRDRSRSPRQTVEDSEKHSAAVDIVAGQKRAHESSAVEEAPSLFSNKREKLDNTQHSKRVAAEVLNRETKKQKVAEQ